MYSIALKHTKTKLTYQIKYRQVNKGTGKYRETLYLTNSFIKYWLHRQTKHENYNFTFALKCWRMKDYLLWLCYYGLLGFEETGARLRFIGDGKHTKCNLSFYQNTSAWAKYACSQLLAEYDHKFDFPWQEYGSGTNEESSSRASHKHISSDVNSALQRQSPRRQESLMDKPWALLASWAFSVDLKWSHRKL